MRGQILRYPSPGWAAGAFARVFPGAHVLCFGRNRDALEAEDAGFEVRDAIEVIGPQRHRVWLLRKPVEEPNIVAQVLKTGTGAIWIDGCRVGVTSDDARRSARPGHSERKENATSGGTLGWNADRMHAEQHPGGRWPSNLVLVHMPGCQRSGTKKVRGSNNPGKASIGGMDRTAGTSLFGQGGGGSMRAPFYTDADNYGMETVEAWVCEPGCPVAKLDEQSGTLTSGVGAVRRKPHETTSMAASLGGTRDTAEVCYGDSGGASRFFPQFADESELDAWLLCLILGPQMV